MKKVKVTELREGDIFILNDRYYEVTEATHEELSEDTACVIAKCFMAPYH